MDRRGTRPRHAVLTVPTLGLPLWMDAKEDGHCPSLESTQRKHSANILTFDRWEASGVCVCYILMYCCQSDRALPAAAPRRVNIFEFNMNIFEFNIFCINIF